MESHPSIGVAVITHHAKKHLPYCLPPLINSPLQPKIVVVNSSSNDGTVELAESMGVTTMVVPRSSFNHGYTREQARKFLNTDIVVMITPDAYATSEETLSQLVQPIIEKKASVAYAKQIPHDQAGFFESFPRYFNYPKESHIRGYDDMNTYGAYSYFCSNSFAAYSNEALNEIGGFIPVLLGEDTIAVSNLLRKGHRIAYVAEAKVKHSHHYSLKQEFQRHFDTGIARKSTQHLMISSLSDQQRGVQFMVDMLKKVLTTKPLLLPYAVLHCTVKYLGYMLGRRFVRAPKWIVKRCSSQDYFWNSEYSDQVKPLKEG
jgi:GT2 family glycosyltransferase